MANGEFQSGRPKGNIFTLPLDGLVARPNQ